MAYWVRKHAVKTKNSRFGPLDPCGRKRTNPNKSSSDLYTPRHTHTQYKINTFNFLKMYL